MGHEHKVSDKDAIFSINAITRAIKNESNRKTTLIQGDHNSERYTFEIPRYIEDHDMSLCNKVEVHYFNIKENTNSSVVQKGIYTVDDLHISEEDESKVVCSWLISENATEFKGVLNFLLRYMCVEDGIKTYAWNTAFYTSINVAEGSDAAETFEEAYVDIIEQWKASVMQYFQDELGQWKDVTAKKVREEAFEDIAVQKERIDFLSNYVTPEMFGAKGDGVTDDTEAIEKAIENASSGSILHFLSGTYGISNTIKIEKDISVTAENGSILRALNEMESMLEYSVAFSRSFTRKISDIALDCNGLANKGLNITGAAGLELRNILVLNPVVVGIDVNSDSLASGSTHEVFGSDLCIRNTKLLSADYRGIGLHVRTADCRWENIVTVNMHIGVKCTNGSNFFNHVHPWVSNSEILPSSIGVRNEALGVHYSDCYFDTLSIGIFTNRTTTLKNCNFRNSDKQYQYYTENPTFIIAEDAAEVYANNCYFENAVDNALNPIIAQGVVKIIDAKFSTPMYSVDEPIVCRTSINRYYICRFGSVSVSPKSYYAKALTLPNVLYIDAFYWTNHGTYFPDGIIANVYLKDNCVELRLYNTTDKQIEVTMAAIRLMIIQKAIGTNMDYEIIEQ